MAATTTPYHETRFLCHLVAGSTGSPRSISRNRLDLKYEVISSAVTNEDGRLHAGLWFVLAASTRQDTALFEMICLTKREFMRLTDELAAAYRDVDAAVALEEIDVAVRSARKA